jgi:hypothetical protein
MGKTTLETRVSQAHRALSAVKNTERIFVPPNKLGYVTGTWTLAVASNVWSMNKTAADNTATVYIPFPGAFSDAALDSGAGATDRGVQVIGVELICTAATADLDAAITLKLYSDALADNGAALGAATEVPTVLGGLVGVAHTTNVRRVTATVDGTQRYFIDSGRGIHGEAVIDAGASTVVKVFGAIWHIKRIEE